MHRETVSAVETARRLSTDLDYTYKLLRTERLEGRKVNGEWRVPVAAIEQRLKAREERLAGAA